MRRRRQGRRTGKRVAWSGKVPRHVAMHEAGHAVAALAMDLGLHRIQVFPQAVRTAARGTTHFRGDIRSGTEGAFRRAFMALAGPAAERLVCHSSWVRFYLCHIMAGTPAGDDIGCANAEIGKGPELTRFTKIVDAFVRQRRPAIEALAVVIGERCDVTGEDARAIVEAADPTLARSITWVRGMVPQDFPGFRAGGSKDHDDDRDASEIGAP